MINLFARVLDLRVYLKSSSRLTRVASLVAVTLALGLGWMVYLWGNDLDAVDALYLTIVTVSTVGYGDISPEGAGMRTFTVFYILLGSGYVFVQLADLFAGVLEGFSTLVKRGLDRFDRTQKRIDTNGDGKKDAGVAGRSMGLSGTALDLDGDGQADFIAPPGALVFWGQELFPAVVLLMAVQLGSAGIFVALEPGLDFGAALYHCFITATTVGYGDVPLTEPRSRLFACLHIVVSVSWLAALLGNMDRLRASRNGQLKRAELFTNPPDKEEVMALDHDGKGVDKLEFVVGMMILLDVELCGEPLTWDDVRPWLRQFENFDVSKTGRLSAADLEAYVNARDKSAACRRSAARDKSPAAGKARPSRHNVQRGSRAVTQLAAGSAAGSADATPVHTRVEVRN